MRHVNDPTPNRRLRIGHVSADFRDHPVARFLEPLIAHRDTAAFEIIAYSSVENPDEVTTSLRSRFDNWHDVAALNAGQLAELIRSHQIDILIDLAGHTSGGRLETFARKPAPVQMTYLGYPDTTGLTAIDYRITDALADPPGAESRHTEQLARVEGCFLCYPWPQTEPPRRATHGPITFASFNNLAKISPTTIRLWRDVLAAVPSSRMLIKTTSLGDAPTRAVVAERFARLGLPLERVELLGPAPTQPEHLATYARVTVALDTFPYNGTTTTCEALSMGVPVVSLFGEHHASRVGLSLLTACGLAAWATDDPKRFVEIAARLAETRPTVSILRPDPAGFTRTIERIYRDAWTRWCDQHSLGTGVTRT
jgi:predicted O-linked N-acetylglucosamine transferase (SPINDLY family)